VEIYNLMNMGESALTKPELKKLSDMSVAAEKYEDEVLTSLKKSLIIHRS
jgi:hypothetical protein